VQQASVTPILLSHPLIAALHLGHCRSAESCESRSLIDNKLCNITSLSATPATPLFDQELTSTSPTFPSTIIHHPILNPELTPRKFITMPLFKHKEKNRPDLTNQQTVNPASGQPQHQHNNSYHDSTYYSNSNSSTMDSRVQQPSPQPNQNQNQNQNQNREGQRPGTTVTTTTTTTTSK
jgi:hypothetical protein